MVKYFKNVKKEFNKIKWATKKEMFSDFWFITGMSIFFIVFFAIIDVIMNTIL